MNLRNTILVFCFLFLFPVFLPAKIITIDGSASDWAVIPATTFAAIKDNSSIIIDDEWIWKDKLDDIRYNPQYPINSEMSNSADLTEFRVSASTASLYFLMRFKELNLSASGYIWPYVQIAVGRKNDTSEAGIRYRFVGLNTDTVNPDKTELTDYSRWSSLLGIFQSDLSTSPFVNNRIWRWNSTPGAVYDKDELYGRIAVSTGAQYGNFIETEARFSELMNFNFLNDVSNKQLTFAVIIGYACRPFGITTNGNYMKEFEPDTSGIVDCITLSTNTWSDISDEVLNHYFEIRFSSSGNILTDESPPSFSGDNIKVNTIINNRDVFVSEGAKPQFTWEYQDADNDMQTGVQIMVGEDDVWSDTDGIDGGPAEMWDYGLSCSTETSSSKSYFFSPVKYEGRPLAQGVTYYVRARVVNSRGAYSPWAESYFVTAKSSVTLNIGGDDVVVDWNNPFYPSGKDDTNYTRIRYTVGADKHIELSIFNILGERIRTLDAGDKLAKTAYSVVWDGKTDSGDIVGSGVYLVHLKTTLQDKKTSGVTKRVYVVR